MTGGGPGGAAFDDGGRTMECRPEEPPACDVCGATDELTDEYGMVLCPRCLTAGENEMFDEMFDEIVDRFPGDQR